MSEPSNEPRPLAAPERSLLDAFLAHEFVGAEELRQQALSVEARRGCDCGCGTIELIPKGADLSRSSATNPVPVDGEVLDAEGNEIGGLILFVKDGLLSSLEVYSHSEPLPLPMLNDVRWY